jgi:hypothetical protein
MELGEKRNNTHIKTVMKDYFQFYQQYYKQTEGLPMDDPASVILAESYIEYKEHIEFNST